MTNQKSVEASKAISYGWDKIKKDFWYFVGLALVTLVIGGIGSRGNENPNSLGILSALLTAWMTSGQLKLTLSYYDGKKMPFVQLFNQLKYFWRILGASILLCLIVVAGLILLIVPGIYFALKYQFTLVAIVDKNMGITEAMNESAKLTEGIKLSLLKFWLLGVLVIILGGLALGVGVLVAIPVVWLAEIDIYRKLQAHVKE